MMLVEIRQIKDDLRSFVLARDEILVAIAPLDRWFLTSGMNPPCKIPSKARVARKDVRPLSQNWPQATKLHRIIWEGIQRSGPIHLLTSWLGSSAQRKASLKTVFPRL